MLRLAALLTLAAAPAESAPSDLARGFAAFRAGDYPASARVLAGAPQRLPRTRDYALYLLGESQFYDGAHGRARATFTALSRLRDSRFVAIAPWRVADCLWMEGRKGEAGAAYRKLVAGNTAGADAALARFRLADVAEASGKRGTEEARRLFVQIHLEFPAHPLAAEAARRAAALGGGPGAAQAALAPRDRLRRAENLAGEREYQAALDELARLPAELPVELACLRDFAAGMAKYRMRRDYAGAAELLFRAAGRLPDDKAAFAAFHAARALSRIDRDDEAIAGYLGVVESYPASKWAAEAQFRAGWLEVNRGRFREALPALRAAVARFAQSAWGNDAAWYLALSHHMLGQPEEALRALDRYERLSRRRGADAGMRVCYWRARFLSRAGVHEEARRQYRDCALRSPLGYYGLLAVARLREVGESVPALLPAAAQPAPDASARRPRDPLLERVDELAQAGLDVEAGIELERGEAGFLRRMGKARGLALLLGEYPRVHAFHRAFRLAEAHGASALGAAPAGGARLFWHNAYPRAYREPVAAAAAEFGVPELLVYAIMRKESGFAPHVVSYADARGLLQLLPGTASQAAAKLKVPFHEDELFQPETNIRLGTYYVAGLFKRFREQLLLAAGAYNAGPRAMTRWCDQWGKQPIDELVELVTYDQAREYMKRVAGIYARYQQLYNGVPFELSLTVTPQYHADGPDY